MAQTITSNDPNIPAVLAKHTAPEGRVGLQAVSNFIALRGDAPGVAVEARATAASGGVKIVKIGRFENRCRRERTGRKRDEEFSGLDAVFHTEACAFDKDDFGVIKLRAVPRIGKLRESLSRRLPSVVPKRHCSCLLEEFIQSRTTQRE